MTRPLVDAAIAGIAPYEPGKPLEELQRELGDRWPKDGAVKLASNENPLGPSPLAIARVQEALAGTHRYPDGGSFYFRQRIARHHDLPMDHIAAGNGSNELIDLIVQAFCSADETVLAPACSFACYRLSALGHRRGFAQSASGPDFAYDFDALIAACTPRTKVVFFANPSNPTGVHASGEMVKDLVERLPADIVLVVDEAYIEFVAAGDYRSALDFLAARERLIVLRTFSKAYGLAGLRAGYAVARPALLDPLHKIRLAFNLNLLGQVAGEAALDDTAHVARVVAHNTTERQRVTAGLRELGIPVIDSQTNFLLADLSPRDGRELFGQLLSAGVIVRPMGLYGLPHHLRISFGTVDENTRLLGAFRAVL